MNKSTCVLLLLVAIALALAPLRAALTMPVTNAAESATHCTHMQTGMHAMAHTAGRHSVTPGHSSHGCDKDCKGLCCDGACGHCVHAAVALPVTLAGGLPRCNRYLNAAEAPRYIGRTLYPPLRPPIALPA